MPSQVTTPNILIVGPSGSGKSFSMKNLPKDSTLVLNLERKPLPFKGGELLSVDMTIDSIDKFEQSLSKGLIDDKVKVIVIDSFTKYTGMLLRLSKSFNKGYEIWNFYNDKISALLETIKSNKGKFIIILGIDERVELIGGDGIISTQRRIKVAGKAHEGCIEYEFTIVLFTYVKAEHNKPSTYSFMTNNTGDCSAKSPEEMFPRFIENDLNVVVTRAKEYYKIL